MIRKFEKFISDTNKDYEHENIVVAIHDDHGRLKIGKKYILTYPQPVYAGNYFYVKDIVNNEPISSHKSNFITEMEYEIGSDIKKYNI